MLVQKEIVIDGLPLSYHKVALAEVDIDSGVIRLTVRSWFNQAAGESGTPPHRVHALHSYVDSNEMAVVLQRALQDSVLSDALIVPPPVSSE